jgi:hypothetical protein
LLSVEHAARQVETWARVRPHASSAYCPCGGMRQIVLRLRRFCGRRLGVADGGGSAFALRLAVSFAAALMLVGVAGYVFMNWELHASQIERFTAAQRSDARAFERVGASSKTHAQAIFRIDQVLDAAARRDGTLAALLIGPDRVIRASGNDALVGRRDTDDRIEAALLRGKSYSGHETGADRNAAHIEFVTPVNLPDGPYALETIYDNKVLHAQLSHSAVDCCWWVCSHCSAAAACFICSAGGRCCAATVRLCSGQRATG